MSIVRLRSAGANAIIFSIIAADNHGGDSTSAIGCSMKTIARTRTETLKDQERSIHEEARMVLPGVQALFGFQLVAVFNQRFADMEAADRGTYFLSLLLVTGAIGLLMAPAA